MSYILFILVTSSDGRVKIHNLALNCKVLNDEFLSQLPFSLKSITIDKLEFTVSFSSVMNDGCHFNIDGLSIDIVPNEYKHTGKFKNKSDINHNNEPTTENISNDEDLGTMQFITNWIEVIIARLQIVFMNININIHTGIINSSYLNVKISELLFYNTHPSLFNGMSSVDVSNSLGASEYYSTKVLGAKKYLNIKELNVFSIEPSSKSSQPILEICNGLRVQSKIDDTNNIDIDINIQDCLLKLNDLVSLSMACSLLAAYSTKISGGNSISSVFNLMNLDTSIPSSTMETLLWLSKEYDSNHNKTLDGINYSLILRLMKKYRDARDSKLDACHNKSTTSKYELCNSIHVSDDIDFPSSEDDEIGHVDGDDSTINSDMFHDPTGTHDKPSTNSKASFSQSAQYMSQSYYGHYDDNISSGRQSKNVYESNTTAKRRTVNVTVRSTNMNISLSHMCETGNLEYISLLFTNTIITSGVQYNYYSNGNSEINVSSSVCISDVSIVEGRGDEGNVIVPLLNLINRQTNSSNTVIDAPSIDINLKYIANSCVDSTRNKCDLTVNGGITRPLIFSLYIDRILHWQNIVNLLIESVNNAVSTPNMYSPCSISMLLVVPDISIILHTALSNKFPWSDLLLDMDLSSNSYQWKQVNHDDSLTLRHMEPSPAGFLLNAIDVKLNFDFNLLNNSVLQSIETSYFATDMFIKNSSTLEGNSRVYLTSQVGVVHGKYNQSRKLIQPVVVRFYKEIMDEINNLHKSQGDIGRSSSGVDNIINESGMITPPTVDDGKLLHLQAHKVVSKLTQREYNCLIAISKAISSSDVTSQSKSPSKDGIGAVLDADIALITVCKSADYIYNNPNNVKPDEDKLFSFHMSAVKPVIEIYSGDNDAYISIISEDFSMFEDTLNEHDILEDDIKSPPFLHRTTLHFNRNYDDPQNLNKKNNLFNGAGFFTYAPSISKMKNKSNCVYPHVFSVQILLTDEYLGVDTDLEAAKVKDTLKTMRFHMDFQDVTLRYNPTSSWLLQVVDILTPVPTGKNYEVRKIKENKKKYKPPSRSQNSSNSPYERTIVSTRIRKGLIDYQCLPLNSRSIISVGMLKMSATIVSNCDAFNLKFTLTDFAYYLSNMTSKTYEQSPIDRYGKCPDNHDGKSIKVGGPTLLQRHLDYDRFIDESNLIQLITIDSLENLVSFQTSTGVALLLSINIGVCYVYACLDSLTLLADTIKRCWSDFSSENTTTNSTLSTSLVTISESALSSDSICDKAAISTSEIMINSDTADQKHDGLHSITLTDLYNDTILNNENALKIIDDYYGAGENRDEMWDAQYDYDDDLYDQDTTDVTPKKLSHGNTVDDEGAGEGGLDKSVTSSTVSFTGFEYNFFNTPTQEVFDDADLDSILEEEPDAKPNDAAVASSKLNATSMMLSSLLVGKRIIKKYDDIEMDVINQDEQLSNLTQQITLKGSNNDPIQEYVDLDTILADIGNSPPLSATVKTEEANTDFQNAYGPDCHRDVDQEAAWYSNVQDTHSALLNDREEHAQWLGGENPIIQAFYIHTMDENEEEDASEDRSVLETRLVTKTLVTIKGNLRLRLFKGCDWINEADTNTTVHGSSSNHISSKQQKLESLLAENNSANVGSKICNMAAIQSNYFSNNLFEDPVKLNNKQQKINKSTREKEDYIDIVLKDNFIRIRQYDSNSFDTAKCDEGNRAGPIEAPKPCDAELHGKFPTQRVTMRATDTSISISLRGVRKKKVLHSWVTSAKPKQLNKPFIAVSMVEYSSIHEHEEACVPEIYFKLIVSPIRCYLDEYFINFMKAIAVSKRASNADGPRVHAVFGNVSINAIEIKIDYLPGYFHLRKLQEGDYLQLLNMFPLEGMELVIKKTHLTNGINGIDSLLNIIMEGCINDIYSNQMHKVISGTAPFRGISNIGAGLQDLMLIPMKDYRKTGGVIKELRRGTASLLRTLTREALHASHKITMFVARGLTELTSIADPGSSNTTHINTNRKDKKPTLIQNNQPTNAKIGLEKGLQSLTREVNIAFDTIVALPIKQYERDGAGGYTKAVIRALPIAVLRPIAGVSEALSYTLLGIRNQFDPSFKHDEEGLYKFNKDVDI